MTRNDLVKLYGSTKMPVLGLGTAIIPYHGETVEEAIQLALKLGYRHFDTARVYYSEPAVGKALVEATDDGKVNREDIFVTSKLWGSDHHDPVSALKQTLRNMGMDYLDMYLVHWPAKLKNWTWYAIPEEEDFEELDMETTWLGMQKCLEMGLCNSIGVEMHPMWRQNRLRKFCGENKIHVSAYSPLGGAGSPWGTRDIVDNPIIQSIALKHQVTPAQVALSWGLSKGASMITKSFNQERMKENLGALELILDDEDICKIERLIERKIMRGEFLVNGTTSPYKTIQELWDDEI
ncbi:hypothetical protein IFM89_005605 [Coptis chinensis]|uniref:NADP-dependent oxidoreductase domain-containing protein n=1 Tax=Coptis chinensis TaxID=261450 RepID=A0A835I8B6_9MAGN|nr:hypothetical protein IFM89_005605 [Coptis chinensis]